jgi:hypothetical protein
VGCVGCHWARGLEVVPEIPSVGAVRAVANIDERRMGSAVRLT